MTDIPTEFPKEDFDEWAANYDKDVQTYSGFPFSGYEDLFNLIGEWAQAKAGQKVLDLGTGTGNLAVQFVEVGCQVWGTDFSSEMLVIARKKLPQVTFLESDLALGWPQGLEGEFDLVVSAYVFHHFKLEDKIRLVKEILGHIKENGRLIIGDLSFADIQKKELVRRQNEDSWDEEYFWMANNDLPIIRQAGLQVKYRQVSECAGVYMFQKG